MASVVEAEALKDFLRGMGIDEILILKDKGSERGFLVCIAPDRSLHTIELEERY